MNLLLKPIGRYNNIPQSVLDEIPDIVSGTVVSFRFKHYTDPSDNRKRWAHHLQFPSLSIFFYKGKSYRIGLVNDEGNYFGVSQETIRSVDAYPNFSNGTFTITAGTPSSDELIQYFSLCNFISQNICDEKMKRPEDIIMEQIHLEKEASDQLEKEDKEFEVVGKVAGLDNDGLRRAALLLGIKPKASIAEIRRDVRQAVKANPLVYLERIEDPNADVIITVNQAFFGGIVGQNSLKKQIEYVNGGAKIIDSNDNRHEIAAQALVTAIVEGKDGKAILEGLKRAIEPNKADKAEDATTEKPTTGKK